MFFNLFMDKSCIIQLISLYNSFFVHSAFVYVEFK